MPAVLTFAAIISGMLAYILGLAWYQSLGSSLLNPGDLIVPRIIDVVVAIWCFWVGSSIGSFLNVVAWRLPRGENLNGRSHCPRCRCKLRARDNFPVFGWLALGGRCHTCRLPISSRYPIVEAAVGLCITAISIGQIYQLSLPYQAFHDPGPLRAPIVDLPTLATLLYHVVGVSFAWAYGLIRLDGHPLPRRLTHFGLASCALPMLVFPDLMVISWRSGVASAGVRLPAAAASRHVEALVRLLTALVAAVVLARSLARGVCPSADPKLDPLGRSTARLIDLVAILAVPAILVGWQALPAVALVASMIACGLSAAFRRRSDRAGDGGDALGRFAVAIPLAMTLQITFWRGLQSLPYWPSDQSSPWTILAWAAACLLVPLWLRDRPATPHTDAAADNQPGRSGEGNSQVSDEAVIK